MNNTNRGANRLFIALIGIVLLALGLLAVALATVPVVRTAWVDSAGDVRSDVARWFADTGGSTGSGANPLWIAVIAILAVVIVLLVVFVFRQGHGHTLRFVADDPTDHGKTVVDSRVAEQALQESLDDHPELVASHVSTYLVRGVPVLKVSATARRGVSPTSVVDTVESLLAALETLLGRPVFASVQVGGGFRSKVSGGTRLR